MATSNHIKLEPEHLSAIKALADEIHRPVEEVNNIYTSTFESLNTDAHIKDYLVVLTCKKVRDELRKQAQPSKAYGSQCRVVAAPGAA